MFDNILNSSKQNKNPIKSPWSFYSFMSTLKENQLVYYILIPLIIILSSGGVVFASQDSLPDNILYPLKVKVVEPIIGAMTFSPKNKAKYEVDLATERLVEAEKLANLGKLNKYNEKKINDLLENHTKSLDKALILIKDTNSNDQQVSNIVTNFNAGMNAHAKILDIISKQDNNEDQLDNNKISETARNSANSITNSSSKRVNKNGNNVNEYTKRKDTIESLINKTNIDLGRTINEKAPVKQKIINDTSKTLDDAKNFMQEADKNNVEGNSIDAYKALLNSESSVKEANILLKEGSKFKIKDNSHRGANRKQNND